ncbi:cell division protein FtsX [Jiella marina]|uniref:cell division protein FtsX n=1 Tax=Jiella sp. LLJ827 TaxID=2917712 RepID=UPI00210112E9|nr:ABC transporter permease [Jiella sp. LLJ827]MCQ0990053.1 ABC transporter permease [Jiella sp. LLJ827]
MTDLAAHLVDIRERVLGWANSLRQPRATPIVPPGNVAGRALTTVIAIMTFLASLTVGGVSLVSETAGRWQNDISEEITVQVKPAEGLDMLVALETVRQIAIETPGVVGASIMDEASTGRLLEPWLGEGVDLDELPVPRLVIIGIDSDDPPDFAALGEELRRQVPQSELDDHRAWVSRLVAMARSMVLAGSFVLALVLIATILTVVFATRGAMSGNRQIVEVLHFVGARAGFIASEFQRHFLRLGLIGAATGGVLAMMVFALIGSWTDSNRATPEADQISALFGSFSIGWFGYAGVVGLIVTVATLTALTSRWTVTRHLAEIDMISPVEG